MATQSPTYQPERTISYTGPTWWDQHKPSCAAVAIALGALAWLSLLVVSSMALANHPAVRGFPKGLAWGLIGTTATLISIIVPLALLDGSRDASPGYSWDHARPRPYGGIWGRDSHWGLDRSRFGD